MSRELRRWPLLNLTPDSDQKTIARRVISGNRTIVGSLFIDPKLSISDMSGPIVRTGTNPKFWSNWDKAFGGGKSSDEGDGKKAAAPKAKKAAKKKSVKKTKK